MAQERTTFTGRFYRLDDARLEPRPVQRPRIPILIAAHRPRMLRIAARYADQWDTFAAMAGTATDGVEAELAERIATLDNACRAVGRNPGRDPPLDLGDERCPAVRRRLPRLRPAPSAARVHRLLDGSPGAVRERVLRRVATEVIPELRAGRLLD